MLRPIVRDDFESVFGIYMDPTVNPFMSWEIMPRSQFQAIFDSLLDGSGLFAYEIAGTVAAVIRLDRRTHRLSHIAYVGGFGVHSKFQGQGLGKRIMTEVIERLTADGIKRIELIVEGDNLRAIQLYESLRFEKEGTLKPESPCSTKHTAYSLKRVAKSVAKNSVFSNSSCGLPRSCGSLRSRSIPKGTQNRSKKRR